MKQSKTKYTFLATSKHQFWSNLKYVLQSDRWCLDVGKNPLYHKQFTNYLCNTTILQRKKCLQTD